MWWSGRIKREGNIWLVSLTMSARHRRGEGHPGDRRFKKKSHEGIWYLGGTAD